MDEDQEQPCPGCRERDIENQHLARERNEFEGKYENTWFDKVFFFFVSIVELLIIVGMIAYSIGLHDGRK